MVGDLLPGDFKPHDVVDCVALPVLKEDISTVMEVELSYTFIHSCLPCDPAQLERGFGLADGVEDKSLAVPRQDPEVLLGRWDLDYVHEAHRVTAIPANLPVDDHLTLVDKSPGLLRRLGVPQEVPD